MKKSNVVRIIVIGTVIIIALIIGQFLGNSMVEIQKQSCFVLEASLEQLQPERIEVIRTVSACLAMVEKHTRVYHAWGVLFGLLLAAVIFATLSAILTISHRRSALK